MSLIITPGQLIQRAEFYHQLGQLTGAGLGVVRALEILQRSSPARSYRSSIRKVLEHIHSGGTLTDGLERAGRWLPAFDTALLHAGEQSGRLESCFILLADYYSDRARLARQVITDLAYPVFVLHFAVLILPFPQFFATGDAFAYAYKTLGILLPLYLLVFLMVYAAQSRHGETWRAMVERLLHPVPVLGKARHYLSLARLASALEALLSAGVTIIEAWELAANASGSPAFRRIVRRWKAKLHAGRTPAELVSETRRFPELFASEYASAEISGKLDETLTRLHRYYQEEGSRKLHAIAQWTPRILYLLLAVVIGYKIIQFWSNYFRQISEAGGF